MEMVICKQNDYHGRVSQPEVLSLVGKYCHVLHPSPDISMIFTTYRSSGLGDEEDFTLILFPARIYDKGTIPWVINRMGLRPFYAFLRPHYLYLYMPPLSRRCISVHPIIFEYVLVHPTQIRISREQENIQRLLIFPTLLICLKYTRTIEPGATEAMYIPSVVTEVNYVKYHREVFRYSPSKYKCRLTFQRRP